MKAILRMASNETPTPQLSSPRVLSASSPRCPFSISPLRPTLTECVCHDYLYCEPCNARRSLRRRQMPLCQTALKTKSRFFYTTDKAKYKVLTKWAFDQ